MYSKIVVLGYNNTIWGFLVTRLILSISRHSGVNFVHLARLSFLPKLPCSHHDHFCCSQFQPFPHVLCFVCLDKVSNMRLVTRKPVFGVCDHARLKPACSATETSQGPDILAKAIRGIILSRQWTTNVLISLRGCARKLICAFVVRICKKSRFCHDGAHIMVWF